MQARAGSFLAGLLAAGLASSLLAVGLPPALGATSPGIISTLAGGPGRGAALNVSQMPLALAVGPGGALYVGDQGVVREFTARSLTEGVTAGIGSDEYPGTGDGGPATRARLGFASGLAVDGAGNVVIADPRDARVRVVAHASGTFYGRAMTAGDIYTVAGNGKFGFSGDGGPATSAELAPSGVTVDAWGNLLITDPVNERVRVVAHAPGTFYGRAMTAGDIYTIAGNGTAGYSGDGGLATSAELNEPTDVGVDAAGNVVITDTGNHRVRAVAATSGTFYHRAMTAGHIYTVAGNGGFGFSGDGGPATSAKLKHPDGVTLDSEGNLIIADPYSQRVRVVAAASGTFYGQAMTGGDIYTVAGDGTFGYSGDGIPAASAELDEPQAVAVDAAGNLVIGDTQNYRVRVVAAASGTFYSQAMTAGDIYTVAGNGQLSSSGDFAPPGNAELRGPTGIAASKSGNVLVASRDENKVRLVAATSGTLFGRPVVAGRIYTVAGNGGFGYSGDGGPATSTKLNTPHGIAVDAAGNAVIADTANQRVRVVAATSGTFYGRSMTAGHIYKVAGDGHFGFSGDGGPAASAELSNPDGVAVDAAGDLLIADTQNVRVRVVAAASGTFYGQSMTAGDIYTVAGDGTVGSSGDGGPATAAELNGPAGVTVDRAGNLLIADMFGERIRVVASASGTFYGQAMTAGDIYTVAGDGTIGFSGDGGPAAAAELGNPAGIAVDGAGNLLIADTGNDRIRVVAAASGTFYGQVMSAGDIYTVAGSNKSGFAGDNGPAAAAQLSTPGGVAADGAGNLLIADTGNGRIRLVTG